MSGSVVRVFDPDASFWGAALEGREQGVGISFFAIRTAKVGRGPGRHRHPYDEVILVRLGIVRFTIGMDQRDASAGEVVIVPAGTWHSFQNLGPGPMETLDIFANDAEVTEWPE